MPSSCKQTIRTPAVLDDSFERVRKCLPGVPLGDRHPDQKALSWRADETRASELTAFEIAEI